MKIILDIDDKAWKFIENGELINYDANKIKNIWAADELMVAIDNSISLPDNATNGDVIKALFAEYPVLNTLDGFTRMIDPIHNLFVTGRFHNDWWNAPYKVENEDKE